MHKIAQKVTSIALAASMLLSMFATNTVAFADEFTDSTTVSEDATRPRLRAKWMRLNPWTRPTLTIPKP